MAVMAIDDDLPVRRADSALVLLLLLLLLVL